MLQYITFDITTRIVDWNHHSNEGKLKTKPPSVNEPLVNNQGIQGKEMRLASE